MKHRASEFETPKRAGAGARNLLTVLNRDNGDDSSTIGFPVLTA